MARPEPTLPTGTEPTDPTVDGQARANAARRHVPKRSDEEWTCQSQRRPGGYGIRTMSDIKGTRTALGVGRRVGNALYGQRTFGRPLDLGETLERDATQNTRDAPKAIAVQTQRANGNTSLKANAHG